jgi:hypothetical protein
LYKGEVSEGMVLPSEGSIMRFGCGGLGAQEEDKERKQ